MNMMIRFRFAALAALLAAAGAPYDEAVPADKLTIRADGTGFDVDGAWLVANVLAVMNSDDTFQIHVETSAGTADLTVTNKYVG